MYIGSSKCIERYLLSRVREQTRIRVRDRMITFPLEIKENSWSTNIRTSMIISISIVRSLVIRMIDYQEYLN